MANSSIYRDLLFKHRHGLPLWKPDPNANLLDIYTKKGISIGDLGLLTDDGGFDYLFNVHAGAEDPVNQFLGTPSTFQPLPPITNQDIIKTEFQHPEKACITRNASYEVTGAGNLGEAMPGVEVNLAFEFSLSEERAAMLILPHGADRYDAKANDIYLEYAIKYAIPWYQYLNQVKRRGAKNGSLFLVTGCDKSHSWGLAAGTPHRQSTVSFGITLGPVASGTASIRASWRSIGGVESRQYPQSGSAITEYMNQCVFARGFTIGINQNFFTKKLVGPARVKPIDSSSKSFPGIGNDSPFLPSLWRGTSDEQSTSQNPANEPGPGDLLDSEQDQGDFDYSDTMSDSDASDLEYQKPRQDIDIVVVHDSDWITATSNDAEDIFTPNGTNYERLTNRVLELSHPVTRTASAPSQQGPIQPFCAVIIGTNRHTGEISSFLTDCLGITDRQISMVPDEKATRAGIIDCISSLATNEIAFNDPIIIFFTGHAILENSNTACIVPYDYPEAKVIPASVINDLLGEVAAVKGNNIFALSQTLILDCDHAGGFGEDSYASANFSSHVLLAACGIREYSKESHIRGWFTLTLMRVLRDVKPMHGGYTCTYRNIIQRLPTSIAFGNRQTPSCQGKHDDRFLFRMEKPIITPTLHMVISTKQELGRQQERDNALGNIQAGRDQSHKLDISVAMDGSASSHEIVKRLVEQDSDTLRFVGRDNPHQVLVLVRNGNTVFEISDRDELTRLLMATTSDISVIGRILEHASHFLWYLWLFTSLESDKAHVVRDITLEAWRLSSIDGRYTSASSPVGDNLNQDGVIKIPVADADEPSLKLGFKLINTSQSELFVWVFAFNILDLGIDTVYKPAFVNSIYGSGDACLPAGGHLKFSNVSNGELLTVLPSGIKTSVSYLKIFISNFFVDLSFIEQASPLHVDGLQHDYLKFPSDSSDLHDAFTNTSGTLLLRGGGAQQESPSPSPIWNTIVVPIVKRREG
ncbi:hypothetical protein CVT25_004475 [Psilocybe cyanescens]|uniref:Uncharacterized protein n=1 Tax=Psilocybe cyanescens TaxID=93625 RepID=A0A409X2I4_PSICY|nr:hypothetical protein CVT25_004475 [Psilocybe cyanescens]